MTFYEILGVSKSASQEEIRTAYKTLVKKYHPDLYQGDKSFAEKKTKEINEAYDTLSDSTKRAEYNSEIDPPSYNETYSYTPPKYSSNYDPYNSYQNRYSYNNRQTSNYNNPKTSAYEEKKEEIYDSIVQKLGTNFLVILAILIFYIIIFIATLLQFHSYKKAEAQKELNRNFTNTITSNDSTSEEHSDDFDINNYISDSDLRQIYYKYYTDVYDSFDEFKKDFSIFAESYLKQ